VSQILQASELLPGDLVSEYNGAVVASARPSHAYEGVVEVAFEDMGGVYFLFFADWYHVRRRQDDPGDGQHDEPRVPVAARQDDQGDPGDDEDGDRW
jgi:hypothetical protein